MSDQIREALEKAKEIERMLIPWTSSRDAWEESDEILDQVALKMEGLRQALASQASDEVRVKKDVWEKIVKDIEGACRFLAHPSNQSRYGESEIVGINSNLRELLEGALAAIKSQGGVG